MVENLHARERSREHERCPYCHEAFAVATTDEPDERITCAGCGTPHHAECFAENGRCSSLGCERTEANVEGLAHALPVEVIAGRIEWRYRGAHPSIYLAMLGVGIAVTCAISFSATGCEIGLAVGGAMVVLAGMLWVLGRATEALPIDPGDPRVPQPPTPYLPRSFFDPAHPMATTRPLPPVDAPAAPPGSLTCPSCSRPLEDRADLTFCYHCGATLS